MPRVVLTEGVIGHCLSAAGYRGHADGGRRLRRSTHHHQSGTLRRLRWPVVSVVHLSVAWCVFVTSQSTSTVWVSASLSVFLSVQMIIHTSMHFTSVLFLLLLLVVLTSGLMLQEHFYGAQLLQERSERVRRLGVTQRRRVHTSLKVVESSPRVFLLDGISRCLAYFYYVRLLLRQTTQTVSNISDFSALLEIACFTNLQSDSAFRSEIIL